MVLPDGDNKQGAIATNASLEHDSVCAPEDKNKAVTTTDAASAVGASAVAATGSSSSLEPDSILVQDNLVSPEENEGGTSNAYDVTSKVSIPIQDTMAAAVHEHHETEPVCSTRHSNEQCAVPSPCQSLSTTEPPPPPRRHSTSNNNNNNNETFEASSATSPDEVMMNSKGPNDDSYLVEPTPIQPQRIRVVDTVSLEYTWNPKDRSMDTFKKLFTTTATNTTSTGASEVVVTRPIAKEDFEVKQPPSTPPIPKENSAAKQPPSTSPLEDDMRDHANTNILRPCRRSRETWEDKFELLQEYRAKYGNTLVPHNWKGNKKLAQWVKRQRYQYKLKGSGLKSTLTDERIKALEDLGFVWSSHEVVWEERINDLSEFKKQEGHCNVPSIYPNHQQLSVWVRSQRRQYKLWSCKETQVNSSMTNERYQKLKSLGFDFNPRKL